MEAKAFELVKLRKNVHRLKAVDEDQHQDEGRRQNEARQPGLGGRPQRAGLLAFDWGVALIEAVFIDASSATSS